MTVLTRINNSLSNTGPINNLENLESQVDGAQTAAVFVANPNPMASCL